MDDDASAHAASIDEEAAADLAGHLGPDERLEWAARPDAVSYCRVRPRLIALGVFWVAVAGAGFYGFGATFVRDEFGGIPLGVRVGLVALAAAPFLFVAVLCLGGHVAVLRRARGRTAYGLTDRRIVCVRPELGWIGAPSARWIDRSKARLRTPSAGDELHGAIEVHDARGVADALVLECLPVGAVELLRRRTAPAG